MKKLCALVGLWALLAPTAAAAGGMTLPIRGVRTLERGGAFIAGADDADALWLDPAGLAHASRRDTKQLLFDIAYVYQPVEHERIDATGAQPVVTNLQPGRPIPTLAAALTVADRFVIAGGLTAPYAGSHRYAADGPQRYASVGIEGSSFYVITVGAAYAVSDQLRVGATLQNVVSLLDASIVVSGSPGPLVGDPEARDYDMLLRIEQKDYVSPSGSIGAQFDATEAVTLGLAVQAPSRVAGTGTLTTTLPSNLIFENAQVSGDDVHLRFTLPPIVRAGVEFHTPALRVEAAVAIELWSLHDDIEIEPEGVRVDTVSAGSFPFAPMTVPRNYKTSVSPALGVEYHTGPAMFGAGISYETAAAPPSHVSVMNVDASKILVGVGGGYASEGWQIGAAAGYAKLSDVDVPLADAAVVQLEPLRDSTERHVINAGTYKSSYIVAGLRMARRF